MLRCLLFAPNGAATLQPRASPWEDDPDMPHALKGRRKRHALVAPFQGFIAGGSRSPRALPWANLWLPLLGGGPNSATSKLARRVSMVGARTSWRPYGGKILQSGKILQYRRESQSGIALFEALANNAATIQARHPARWNAADGRQANRDRGEDHDPGSGRDG